MGMEVNSSENLDQASLGVVSVATWLSGQDQNRHLVFEDGTVPVFKRRGASEIIICHSDKEQPSISDVDAPLLVLDEDEDEMVPLKDERLKDEEEVREAPKTDSSPPIDHSKKENREDLKTTQTSTSKKASEETGKPDSKNHGDSVKPKIGDTKSK